MIVFIYTDGPAGGIHVIYVTMLYSTLRYMQRQNCFVIYLQ